MQFICLNPAGTSLEPGMQSIESDETPSSPSLPSHDLELQESRIWVFWEMSRDRLSSIGSKISVLLWGIGNLWTQQAQEPFFLARLLKGFRRDERASCFVLSFSLLFCLARSNFEFYMTVLREWPLYVLGLSHQYFWRTKIRRTWVGPLIELDKVL